MNTNLNLAIAAEFDLADKLIEALEQATVQFDEVVSVQLTPFREDQSLRYDGHSVAELKAEDVDWSEYNYLLIAGELTHANLIADAAQAGCIVIDINSVCGRVQEIPMVLPGVNEELLNDLRHSNIVCLPDPQVSQLLLPIASLLNDNSIDQIMVSSLVSASYGDRENISRLAGQTAKLLNGIPLDDEEKRLAFDIFPYIFEQGSEDRLSQQVGKILQHRNIPCHIHSVQVPLFYGLAQQVSLISEYPLNSEALIDNWQHSELLNYHLDRVFTPINTNEEDFAEQLHLSDMKQNEQVLSYWSVTDEQKFSLVKLSITMIELILAQGY